MTRLQAIRSRLEEAQREPGSVYLRGEGIASVRVGKLLLHAPSDIALLLAVAEAAKHVWRGHVACDDSWYSCPKCDDYVGENVNGACTCNGDERQKMWEALAPLLAEFEDTKGEQP